MKFKESGWCQVKKRPEFPRDGRIATGKKMEGAEERDKMRAKPQNLTQAHKERTRALSRLGSRDGT